MTIWSARNLNWRRYRWCHAEASLTIRLERGPADFLIFSYSPNRPTLSPSPWSIPPSGPSPMTRMGTWAREWPMGGWGREIRRRPE